MALISKYRLVLGLFIIGLVLSGITAFPLAWELRLLTKQLGIKVPAPPGSYAGLFF